WRLTRALQRTRSRRPELLARLDPNAEQRALLDEIDDNGSDRDS
nr:tRNA (guanosine(37)-N1)-methyltransferase TrmD [Gammaproteobacteria bacterium]NIY33580.1 tRNA (guanosine(37)-N1)-methyltransferase TrmD [Gammaproteobacteria bacterium]